MGHSVTIAMLVLSIISYVVLWWAMARVNKRRRAGKEDWKKLGKTKEQVDELGDESPSFSYAL